MVLKENRELLNVRKDNIFFGEHNLRNRRGPEVLKKSSEGKVIFEGSKVEKKEEVKERTPVEKYVYLSSLGTILDLADKGTPPYLIKRRLKKAGKVGIDNFIKAGVLVVSGEDKEKAVVHWEKLIDYFKDTDAAMVLGACMNNPGIKPEDAAKIIPIPETSIYTERRKLLKTGFLEIKTLDNKQSIELTEYSKGLGIEDWGLEAKIEKLWRERRQLQGK